MKVSYILIADSFCIIHTNVSEFLSNVNNVYELNILVSVELGSPLPVVPTKTNYPQQLSGYLLTSCSNNNPPQAKLLPVGPSTISKNVTHSDSNLSAANWLFDQLANSDDEHKD